MANDNMAMLLLIGGAALIGATFLLKPGGARADVGTGVRAGEDTRMTAEERQAEFDRQQQLALQKKAEETAAAARARGETPRAKIRIAVGSAKGPALHRDRGVRVTR